MNAARMLDQVIDWWEEHRGIRGFAWGCIVTAWIAFLLSPVPRPEVQGPPPPEPLPMIDKVTTTVCRQEMNGNICVVRETFERKPQP